MPSTCCWVQQLVRSVLVFCILILVNAPLLARQIDPQRSEPTKSSASKPERRSLNEEQGRVVSDDDRLRVKVRFMAAYGHDSAQASLGLEKQGRVGYAIVNLSGSISERLSYVFEINPITETSALPACGEKNFFFPKSIYKRTIFVWNGYYIRHNSTSSFNFCTC